MIISEEKFRIIACFLSLLAIPFYNSFISSFVKKGKYYFMQLFIWLLYAMWHFYSRPAMINVIVNILLLFFISVISYQGELFGKLIISVIFLDFWILIEVFCELLFYRVNFTKQQYFPIRLLGLITLISIFEVLIWGFKRTHKNLLYSCSPPLIDKAFMLLISTGSLIVVNYLFSINWGRTSQLINIGLLLISLLIVLLFNIGIFRYYLNISERIEFKKSNELYEQHLVFLETKYKENIQSQEEIRKLRHDTKHELLTIRIYARNLQNEEIINIVDKYLNHDKMQETVIAKSGNIVIDEIINYWYGITQFYDIKFNVELSIPYDIEIDGRDMIHILGNAIENAIEATKELPKNKREISLSIIYKRGILNFTLINYFDGIVDRDMSGNYITKKKDKVGHGRGLIAIRKYAEKHNGVSEISTENGLFTLKVLLYK